MRWLKGEPPHARAQFIICSQNKYNLFIDFWTILWYNINVVKGEGMKKRSVGEERHRHTRPKNFSKNFEKPLDKLKQMWYNIYVIKRERKQKWIGIYFGCS